ncbi:MAG TPA: cyclic nucleotide-binding domain-containing protein [bacterium]
MSTLTQLVAEHPFFHGMEPDHVRAISACASEVTFDAGDYIFKEGDPAQRFYAIRQGSVAVEIMMQGAGAIPVQTVGPGEVLGWSWLVAPYQKRFDGRVLELTRAIAFDVECLRSKCAGNLKLSHALLERTIEILGQRLQAARLQLLDVYGAPR